VGLFGIGKKKNEKNADNKQVVPEVYDREEFDIIDAHIGKYFGESKTVFHEIESPDLHIDVYICEPTEDRPYYTLVTHGMGAHKMNVPEELSDYRLDRTELLVSLPPDWEINSEEEKWYWPIRWLKVLARMPKEHNTWLGHGHTVPSGKTLADNNEFVCIMLTTPQLFDEDSVSCELPGGDRVLFYQLFPLYESEIIYKREHGAEQLEELFEDGLPFVVDINRPRKV
jgi:hypothetical protein